MQARISSYLATPKGVRIVTLFGYCTKGLPSVEINGIGKLGKSIKEKMIYLTRTRELYLPRRRYVICLDIDELEGDERWFELKYLEFPVLLLYWFLGGIVPISKLDDCLTQGWINTRGEIFQNRLCDKLLVELNENIYCEELLRSKAIVPHHENAHSLLQIDTEELLKDIPGIKCHLNR